MVPLSPFPESSLFSVQEIPNAGRGVIASTKIRQGTPLLRTNPPAINVILRQYRREVCAHCFAYHDGRDLPLRDLTVGFAFCSPECQTTWRSDVGDVGYTAWQAIEQLIRSKRAGGEDDLPDADSPRPSADEIRLGWRLTEKTGPSLRRCRESEGLVHASKNDQRALRTTLSVSPAADEISFLLSGILALVNASTSSSILSLAADSQPYTSPTQLQKHTRSYLHLLAVLPLPLLHHCIPSACLEIATRDSHNSFGIRSLFDDGSEFFGYGVWPEGSYWNHSCAPNVAKRRVGSTWEFWSSREVEEGEELCISYLGGEEKELGWEERRKRLKSVWGFECACGTCRREEEG